MPRALSILLFASLLSAARPVAVMAVPLALTSEDRVLILAAHPDDEALDGRYIRKIADERGPERRQEMKDADMPRYRNRPRSHKRL